MSRRRYTGRRFRHEQFRAVSPGALARGVATTLPRVAQVFGVTPNEISPAIRVAKSATIRHL
jgi:hypothetical protein